MSDQDDDVYDVDQDYDPVYDRLDEILYGGEPDPPDCGICYDSRRAGVFCPGCYPSPRQMRRYRRRAWQRRDRESRGVGLPVRTPFDDEAPF